LIGGADGHEVALQIMRAYRIRASARTRTRRARGAELGELELSLAAAAHRLRTRPGPALELNVRVHDPRAQKRAPEHDGRTVATHGELPVKTASVPLEYIHLVGLGSLPELVEPVAAFGGGIYGGRQRRGSDARRGGGARMPTLGARVLPRACRGAAQRGAGVTAVHVAPRLGARRLGSMTCV
jgi:hypothetical protein